MTERFPITKQGCEALVEELQRLKTIDRPNIIQSIAEARAHGDLSENAEYTAAKEKQGFIEAKISDLQNKLGRAEIIEYQDFSGDQIQFGAKVVLQDLENNREYHYRIVGDYEADLSLQLISIFSPLAQQLIGKKIGEEIEVEIPRGFKSYKIMHVTYDEETKD